MALLIGLKVFERGLSDYLLKLVIYLDFLNKSYFLNKAGKVYKLDYPNFDYE